MKIKAILKTNYKASDGLYPIMINIAGKPPKRSPIGIRIRKCDWSEKNRLVNDTHPNHFHINKKIRMSLLEAEKNYLLGKDKEGVAEMLESEGSFYWYFQKYIDAAHERASHKRAETDESILRRLRQWRSEWSVKDIDSTALKSFREFLDKKGNSPNTVADRMTRIRTVINKFNLSDKKLDYKISFTETTSTGLYAEDIEFLRNADIPPTWIQAIIARDVWLFSLNAAGMRWGDLCRLRVSNVANGRIDFIMHKSLHKGGKRINIPQTAEAKTIIAKYALGKKPDDYLFPILNHRYVSEKAVQRRIHNMNSNFNGSLEAIYDRFGLSVRPTMHMARHAFGDKVDDVYILRNLFGHSSVTTTEKYKKRRTGGKNDEAVLKAME